MKKTIIAALIVFVMLSFVGCNEELTAKPNGEVSDFQSQTEASSVISLPKYEAVDLDEADIGYTVKDCEYKAVETIVNMFGQVEIGSLGEYPFDFFTENGAEGYNFYKDWAKDKRIVAVGMAASTKSGVSDSKDRIVTNTWFCYENSDMRTQFEIVFVKLGDEWLIDSVGLDS